MPKNLPINIIFYLFWESSSTEVLDPVSYMNVIYTLTLAEKINVDMKINGPNRVVDIGGGKDLILNAKCSSFWDSADAGTNCDNSNGLSFRWQCASYGDFLNTDLADYCS